MKVRRERKAKCEDSRADFLTTSKWELLNHASFRVKSRNFTSAHGYNPQTSPHIALYEIVKNSGSSLLDPRYSVLVEKADTLFSECSDLNEKVPFLWSTWTLGPQETELFGEGQEVWSSWREYVTRARLWEQKTSSYFQFTRSSSCLGFRIWALGILFLLLSPLCWTHFLLEL